MHGTGRRIEQSPQRSPRLVAVGAFAGLVTAALALDPAAAFAQAPPGGGQPTLPSLDAQANEGTAKPAAEDLRAGHLYLRAESGLDVPFGQAQAGGTLGDLSPYGLAIGGSLGLGVSRYAELDVTGAYSLFHGSCDSCGASSVAASLGLSYHLLQGASLDPWIRFGVGYRTTELTYAATEAGRFRNLPDGRYHGLDIAKITLGATYFPVQGFGFGPWLSLGVGTFLAGPEPLDGRRAYGFFQLGARFEIDPMSWVGGSSPPATTARRSGPGTWFPASPPSL